MKEVNGKNSTCKNDFYFKILNSLKHTTNLSKIKDDLKISKQNLNYYLRQLKKNGMIINKSQGLWELTNESKNSTKYENFLPKDYIRGHAYIIEVKLPKEIKGWENRIEVLKRNNINFKLVGAKLDVPRIKIMGRKVWLCKDHLRIFDKKDESYYGINAIEGRTQAYWTFYKIVSIIENKLGIIIKPFEFEWRKEHYALIKNDLAIDCNRKGVILRISDETGEWLLVDDSLEKGGELETIGKSALTTNIPMSNWWNENKETKFQVTPRFILKGFNTLTQSQLNQSKQMEDFAVALNKHIPAYEGMANFTKQLSEEIKLLREEIKSLKRN